MLQIDETMLSTATLVKIGRDLQIPALKFYRGDFDAEGYAQEVIKALKNIEVKD